MADGQTQTIDYDALAKQYGAVSSTQPVDYDALARQHGAISSTAPTPTAHESTLPAGTMQRKPGGALVTLAPGEVLLPELSPAQSRAVTSRAGSSLNLAGKGDAGKAQASLWQLQDYLRNKRQGEIASGQAHPDMGYRAAADALLGMGADVAGLVGSATGSFKGAALTAGSLIPYVRAFVLPYLVYQGAKTVAQPQEGESESDTLQRILLGESMTTGAAAGMRTPVKNILAFTNRARSLQSINRAAVGLLQGKLAPLAERIDAVADQRIGQRAQAMEQTDQVLQQRQGGPTGRVHSGGNGVPTVNPTDLATAHASLASNIWATPKASNLAVEAGEHSTGTTFAELRDFRTRLGKTAKALERANQAKDAGNLWSLYKAVSDDMERHATQRLNMPQQWDAYNTDAVARFDMHGGKLGHLFDTQQYSRQLPSVRLFTAGEAPAIALINDLGGKEPPTGEIADWKRNMRDLGMDPDELAQHLKDAERLSKAHNDFTGKGQTGGMWRIAQQGGPVALLALGIYGAAHGMGIYGFMPYLMAMGATRGSTSLAARIRAGETMGDLARQLPPEAFDINRPFSQVQPPQLPQGPPTGAVPPPPAPVTGPNPPSGSQGPGIFRGNKPPTPAGFTAPNEKPPITQEEIDEAQSRQQLAGKLKRARGSRATSGVYGGKR